MIYNDKVNALTSRGRVNLSPKDVSTPLIVGDQATFAERTKIYTSADDLIPDLTNGTTDPEYKAAVIAFAQPQPPAKIVVGRKDIADADYSVTMAAIYSESPDWFGISLVASRLVDDQLAVATWAQANDRMFAVSSADSDIIDVIEGTDATSIAALIKNGQFFNTAVIYHSAAATEYLDTGFVTYATQQPAGSYTMAGKAITGITTIDALTATQEKNVFDKNASIYSNFAGSPEIDFGNVGDGDFFDTVHFMYYSKIKLQEAIIGRMKKRGKIQYNETGFGDIQDVCTPVFEQLKINTGISENGYDEDNNQNAGWSMTFPDLATINPQDKSDRILRNVVINLWYTGAIHKVYMEINIVI